MARKVPLRRRLVFTALAWTIAFLIFFPILWTILTSFKTEGEAVAIPPNFLFFDWTTENYGVVQERSDYFKFAMNSVILALGSTVFALVIAIPAAWAMAFAPGQADEGPADVDALHQDDAAGGRPDPALPHLPGPRSCSIRHVGIITVLMLMNLPIIIWMLYTYFKEIPGEILEASRMDGASVGKELIYVLAPMAVPGIASTVLLNIILAWNEAFWTLSLTTKDAAPLTQFIASYSSPEGLFWAKLSAASTMAIAPILVLGWFAQKQLVRGLTFGAVK